MVRSIFQLMEKILMRTDQYVIQSQLLFLNPSVYAPFEQVYQQTIVSHELILKLNFMIKTRVKF